MDNLKFSTIFKDIFEKNGISDYSIDQNVSKFFKLTEFLISENEKYNLTALRDIEKIIPLHYADCAIVANGIPHGASVLDVGCGGGFPTLPLAILRPDIRVCGLDSTAKKLNFINMAAKDLSLHNVSTIFGRAEELATNSREKYDIVTSRAVARLNILSELCLPFVKIGGCFIAMKGAAGIEELTEAETGIGILGGKVKCTSQYQLYTCIGTEARTNIIIEKNRATPEKYPRAYGIIKKKPL